MQENSSAAPGGAARGGNRGVSPVVGAVMMVGIVVVLAGVTSVMTLNMAGTLQEEPSPTISFSVDYHPSGDGNSGVAYLKITHETGDVGDGSKIKIRDSDGNTVSWEDVWTGKPTVQSGGYVHVDGKGSDCALNTITEGEVYYVVLVRDDGSSHVLNEVEIDRPPSNTYTYTC